MNHTYKVMSEYVYRITAIDDDNKNMMKKMMMMIVHIHNSWYIEETKTVQIRQIDREIDNDKEMNAYNKIDCLNIPLTLYI